MYGQPESPEEAPSAYSPGLYAVENVTRPDSRLLGLYALRTLALCLLGPWFLLALVPLYFKYRTLRYRFDDEGIATRWGLLWRREIHLTYPRIQDIHVSRSLFERWLGLATIHVQTASGNAGAEMSLVGLTDHDLIRDFLYFRMRGTDDWPAAGGRPNAVDASTEHSFEPGAPPADPDATLLLLRELLEETRRLRQTLQKRGGPADAPSPSQRTDSDPDGDPTEGR